MESHSIPPYPKVYELLFGFVSRTDPALTESLTRFFREHKNSDDVSAALYDQFLKPLDTSAHLSSVSEAIGSRIAQVDTVIGTAIVGAATYSRTLDTAVDQLAEGADLASLRALAAAMLARTREMQTSNDELNQNLESSQRDMMELRRQIDQVKRDTNVDALTNLSNRRDFEERLAQEVALAMRLGSDLTVVMLDIDHFKRFNDTFGHQTGDRVLQLVAMTIKAHTKGRDVAARYGGEEFVLLLPQTDLSGAIIVAENIRKALQSKELVKRDTSEKLGVVTASFGVATLTEDDTSFALVERADRCLYAAKARGRNRVISEDDFPASAVTSA